MKMINVVWCDDAVDSLTTDDNHELFHSHRCHIYKTAKNSNELRDILNEDRAMIDAVIVDFNMSDKELVPGNNTASGFRWVHEHLADYAPLPFYLYSARDVEFIDAKYRDFEFSKEDDYFFSANKHLAYGRNRYYQPTELEELLCNMEEEVAAIATPLFRIRQEYSKAFAAISHFQLDPNVFLVILGADEGMDRYDICNTANALRKEIERLFTKFESEGIIPTSYLSNLNKIPSLLLGKEPDSQCYAVDDRLPQSLYRAFQFFLEYTQDGSHTKKYLTIEFDSYLKQSRDIYLVKALAVIGLDIILWADSFYRKYQPLHLFSFQPFETVVNQIVQVNGREGAIAFDAVGKKYFIPQLPKFRYEVGTKVRIEACSSTTCEFGDFYVKKAWNLGNDSF